MRTYLAGLLAAVALPSQPMRRKRQSKRCMIRQQFAVALSLTCCRSMIIPSRSTRTTPTMCSIRTSDLNKEAIRSYDWAENARKDEVKYQLSLAFPFWRGILGPNSVLGASYTQKSGGSFPTAVNLHRSVKPTMSHSCSGVRNGL